MTRARSAAATAIHAPPNTARGARAGTASSAAAASAGKNTITDSIGLPHDDEDQHERRERDHGLDVVGVQLPGLRPPGELAEPARPGGHLADQPVDVGVVDPGRGPGQGERAAGYRADPAVEDPVVEAGQQPG